MNPLRVDNQPGKDTRANVRDVLLFLTEAFYSLSSVDCLPDGGAIRGVGHILGMCEDALQESENEGEKP
jgi:hypothetical protein